MASCVLICGSSVGSSLARKDLFDNQENERSQHQSLDWVSPMERKNRLETESERGSGLVQPHHP